MKNRLMPLCAMLVLALLISGCANNGLDPSDVPVTTQPTAASQEETHQEAAQLTYESCEFIAANMEDGGYTLLEPHVTTLKSYDELLEYRANAEYSQDCVAVFDTFAAKYAQQEATVFAIEVHDSTQTSHYFVREAVLREDSLYIRLERIDMGYGVDATGEWLIFLAIDGIDYTGQPVNVELVQTTVEADEFAALGAQCHTTVDR